MTRFWERYVWQDRVSKCTILAKTPTRTGVTLASLFLLHITNVTSSVRYSVPVAVFSIWSQTVYYLSMAQHFLISLTSNRVSIYPRYTASLLYLINDMKDEWHIMRRLSWQRPSRTMTPDGHSMTTPLLAMVNLLLNYLISLLTIKTITRLQSRIW
jgi:hypothetical protein